MFGPNYMTHQVELGWVSLQKHPEIMLLVGKSCFYIHALDPR